MSDHKCQFAELIGQSPEWQTDPNGLTVCKYCHAPKSITIPAPKVQAIKTVRK